MRNLIISLLSLVGLIAQNTTTFQIVGNTGNVPVQNNNIPYGPVYSIGQTSHQFTIVYYDNGVNVCTTPRNSNPSALNQDPTIEFLGRYDQSAAAFLSLPYFVNNSVAGGVSNFRGSRSFVVTSIAPYIYVQFQWHNWTNCRATIYYGGSTTGIVNNIPTLFASTSNTPSIYSDNRLSTTQALAVTGTPLDMFISLAPFYSLEIWNLTISNPTAGAVTYTIQERLSDGVTDSPLFTFTLAANTTIKLGNDSNPWIKGQIGSQRMRISALGAAGTSTISVTYRNN